MDEAAADEDLVTRVARWFQATPLELVGLLVLLVGALTASVALWWSAAARPNELPPTALDVGVGGDRPASEGGPAGGGAAGPQDVEPSDAGDDTGRAPGVAPEAGTDASDPAPATELTVHVTGAVAAPGLVVLDGQARVGDAVAAAGGLTDDAVPELINLARPLTDGEHIHVLRAGEDPPPTQGTASAAPGTAAGTHAATPIDINTASVEQLQTLPGIGPAKADAIVRHREQHGRFEVPGDLRAVPGIGEATFQRLAELITVG